MDDRKPKKTSHPIIPDDAKAVCMACGEKFLVGDGPHVCPDPIRTAAEEMAHTTTFMLKTVGEKSKYIEDGIRREVERAVNEAYKLWVEGASQLLGISEDRIRQGGK